MASNEEFLHHASYWPIGSMIAFKGYGHNDLGIVISNRDKVITIFWGEKSNQRIVAYHVELINAYVCSRVI
jgi:hypothetical protein